MECNMKSKDFLSNKQLVHNHRGTSTFAIVCNILYYFGICPFKVTSGEGGKYVAKCNKFQKVICGVIHLLGVGLMVPFIKQLCDSFVIHATSDISAMLELVGNLSSYAGVMCLQKILWIDQPILLKFLEGSRIKDPATLKREKAKIIGLCVYTCVLHICSSCYVYLIIGSAGEILLHDVTNMVRYLIRIDITSFEMYYGWALRPFYETFVFLAVSLYSVSRLIIMGFCLTYKRLGQTFENFLENENSIKEVCHAFDSLRNTISNGNRWINELVICHYIGILSFLAYIPALRDSLSTSTGGVPLFKWYTVYLYAVYAIFIGIVCDLPSRVRNSWKQWIARQRNKTGVTLDERFLMVSLAIELETEPIGLSCTFFTVTFNFLGSMVGLVVTYGILVYQVKE